MAKKSGREGGDRLRRDNPTRKSANRSGPDHIKRSSKSGSQTGETDRTGEKVDLVSEAVQQAIGKMVGLSSSVIEQQIRVGQTAAERLRSSIANSDQLKTDVNLVVDSLIEATKNVGNSWLDLLSIVVRSIDTKPPPGGSGCAGSTTVTHKSTSKGGATIVSSHTSMGSVAPPEVVVTGKNVQNVTLDLRPPSPSFVPLVRSLSAGNKKHTLTAATFQLSKDRTHLVLNVEVPSGQPAGTYSGFIVDSRSNERGGTVSVTVGD